MPRLPRVSVRVALARLAQGVALLIVLARPGLAGPLRGTCGGSADQVPRVALISTFPGEADRLLDEMQLDDGANRFDGCVVISGHRFSTGKLRGKDVVLTLANWSIVNSALLTQLTLDRFHVTRIVSGGIAGGVGGAGANDRDPSTPNEAPIGSVVIPQRWGFHQEMYFNNTRRTVPCAFAPGLQLNGVLQDPTHEAQTCTAASSRKLKPGKAEGRALFSPNAENPFLRNTAVSSDAVPQYFLDADNQQQLRRVPFPGTPVNPATDQELTFWFAVDAQLFATAEALQVTLLDCALAPGGGCSGARLDPTPQLVVGQNGVSGPTFVDNARYRKFVARTLNFDESGNRTTTSDVLVLDMSATAAAMVAESNGIPFLAVRTVSDLAGGGAETAAAELETFFAIASENQARVVLALLAAL
jgi:adenosylhomocysteine nucleosidase